MIELRPFDDFASFEVIRNLDPFDQLEAEATRGAASTHLAIWADWRSIEGARLASWIVHREGTGLPVAVIALAHTGQSGVAQAAMLARDHRRFRRELVAVARNIRERMPDFCTQWGIHRIEARCWAGHPRAAAFLQLTGFQWEADLPGFGPQGAETFRQFAWAARSIDNPAERLPGVNNHPETERSN